MELLNRKKQPIEMNFEIGNICIAVCPANEGIKLGVDENYTPFLTSNEPEVVFRLYSGEIPPISLGKKLFGVRTLWGLYDSDDRKLLRTPDVSSPSGLFASRLLSLSPDLKSGEIYTRLPNLKRKIFPLAHPLCQILYTILLSRRGGLLVHSSGIVYNGKGFLFTGRSEAGKTTMARLWNKVKGAEVLNDDRVLIRKTGGRYHIYGTPWLGQGRFVSNKSAPLEKIFFIRHGKRNTLERTAELNAISTLYARSRLTHWDKQGLSSSLKFIEELSQKIPLFDLGFLPDENVIDFILKS